METITKEAKNAFIPEKKYDMKYAYRVLILLAILAAFVMYVDIMLTPSLPSISTQYGIDLATASLIISLYLVFGTAMMPVVGKLGDIYGKKRMLIYVLIAYSALVSITLFISNFNILLISRTFQGIGLSIFPLATSLVREEFPRKLIPRAQALLAAMVIGGVAIGLSIGAFVANSYGWQANYHIALPFIVVLTILIFFIARESIYRNSKIKLDYVGAIWMGIAVGMVVFGVSEGQTWGWTSFWTLFMILGGLLLLIPLAFIERKKTQPILDLKLLSIKNVLISNTIGIITGLSMYVGFIAITYELEEIYNLSIFQTGLSLLPMAISILLVAYPVGILVSRYGVKKLIFIGGLIGAIGFFLLSTATTSFQIILFLTVGAIGLGIAMIATQNLLVLSVDPHEMGLATSLNGVFRNIGSGLGAPLAGSLVSTFVAVQIINGISVSLPTKIAFQYAFYAGVIGFIAISIISLFVKEVIKSSD